MRSKSTTYFHARRPGRSNHGRRSSQSALHWTSASPSPSTPSLLDRPPCPRPRRAPPAYSSLMGRPFLSTVDDACVAKWTVSYVDGAVRRVRLTRQIDMSQDMSI
eukprot:scaffold3516_cov118-Pinguiococcus_pyrenoidosus.AAC.2